MSAECDVCRCERVKADGDYHPMQLFQPGTHVGWYSAKGEEICGSCMTRLFRTANR